MKSRLFRFTLILLLLTAAAAFGQDYSTGLEEVPDKLQKSYSQAQPAGLILKDGAAPGKGGEDSAPLPSSVDLSEYLPPVEAQGRIGSCSAWSTIYYARTILENMERSWGADDDDEIFAPLFTYNQITGGKNQGTYLGDHLEIAVSSGIPTWETYPDNHSLSARASSSALSEASKYKAESWKSLAKYNYETEQWSTDLDEVKAILAQGLPVIAGFATYGDFYSYGGGIYDSTSGSFLGGHAMCIVGYDDADRVVKIVNSWGKDWGENGFLRLSYDLWPALANRGSVVLYDIVENSPVRPEPQPPTTVEASKGESYDSIKVSWNPVEGTEEYTVYRSDNEEAELKQLAMLSTTEYVDSDLLPGVHYIYALKASDSTKRQSGFSPIAEGWTLEEIAEATEIEQEPRRQAVEAEAEAGKPGIPGGMTFILTSGYLALKWNPIENAQSYNIYKWSENREEWMKYAWSLDNALIIRDVYRLSLEKQAYFIVTGVNGSGEGFASDSIYVNFGLKERENEAWKRFISSATADETLVPESRSAAFQGSFYRTDYFDYEYTMRQFREFYEAEQRAFRRYREAETESYRDYLQQENEGFNKWRSQ